MQIQISISNTKHYFGEESHDHRAAFRYMTIKLIKAGDYGH